MYTALTDQLCECRSALDLLEATVEDAPEVAAQILDKASRYVGSALSRLQQACDLDWYEAATDEPPAPVN